MWERRTPMADDRLASDTPVPDNIRHFYAKF